MSDDDFKRRSLNETVMLLDDDGNVYPRKIGTGIKRGELILERSIDGEPLVYLKAKPTGMNLTDLTTGKPFRQEFEDNNENMRLMFLLTEEAYQQAARLYGAPVVR